jgi:hypothetical protein
MKYLKLAIISVVMIFLVFTGISLFIPSNINISRAVNLAGRSEDILLYIKDTSKWQQWYPGFDTLRSKGTLVLITGSTDSTVTAEFSNDKAKKIITSNWQTFPYSASDSLTLQWTMHFKLRWYPWEKLGSLLYEKSYGLNMEMALNNLRQILTK